jgi:hypothetical protein
MEPLNDSDIARVMYRAGYLAGWEERDADRRVMHPDLTDPQIAVMLDALQLLGTVARPDRTTDVEYRL